MNGSGEGLAPRPLASTSTVSLVEVLPSTVIALNDEATASRSDCCKVLPSTAASVVQTASIVAMSGASIAAPLAMPPTLKSSPATTASLGTVSVVMIARAAWAPASTPPRRAMTIGSISGMTLSMGNGIPISPVWQIRISSAVQPMSPATATQSRSTAARPPAPVAALALPDVRITPAARPPVAARWARLTWTGAAAARLVVNTPAAGTARPSDVATTATSGTSAALMPA